MVKQVKPAVKEKVHFDSNGEDIVIERKHDYAPVLEQNRIIRDSGAGMTGENRLVGRIPMYLITEWMKEAGLAPDDTEARKEVIRRKLLSGEFDKFRVWEGTF